MAGLTFANTSTATAGNASAINTGTITLPAVGGVFYIAFSWGNTTVGAANTGDITSVTDTAGNTWHRVGTTVYTPGTIQGHYGFSVWYSQITTSGNSTVTGNVSNGPYNSLFLGWSSYTNDTGTGVDTQSTGNTGTGTAFSTNGVTPTINNDALLVFGTIASSTFTMAASQTFNQRLTGAQHTVIQDLLFVGTGYSQGALGTAGSGGTFFTAPFTFAGTLTGTADWASIIVAVPGLGVEGLAQGDTAETSAGYFQQFQQRFFVGDIFLDGYTGLLFMKNVFMLPRDYWDKALSTPYSGQLFPVAAGTGGPGQVYPY